MSASRVTIPTKQPGDELLANEVNSLRDAVNEHADELDVINPQLAHLLQTALTSGYSLQTLHVPQPVAPRQWYVTPAGIWQPSRAFVAQADPSQGSNWSLIVSFGGQVIAENITDATSAGRAMLTAATAAAQRKLLDNPRIAAGAYGAHPAFTSDDDPSTGLFAWLIRGVLAVGNAQAPAAPAAPTAGQVDDTADTFSGLLVPGFLALADYEVFGVPGQAGTVSAAAAGCDIQNGRLYVRGLTGPLPVGSVGMRVAASGNRPAGASLTNAVAFTGSAIVTPTPTTNHIPVADAGQDATIQLPASSLALRGAASDPDSGDTLTYAWRQITGPNTATGLPATSLNIVASNLVAGTYQFGFQATDNHGGKSPEDFVVVTVQPAATTTPAPPPGGGDYITTDYITTDYIN